MKFGNSEKIVKNCDIQKSQLWDEFERIKPQLTEIARYVYPAALSGLTRDIKNFTADSNYDDDDAERMTSVPFDAFKIAVSGFYTNLTNPSAQWFRLGSPEFRDRDENDEDYYASAYATLTKATRWLINWTNANRALHTGYKHLVAFGFCAFLADEDPERIVHCQCLRVGTYALGIDRKGRVDRLARHFAFTAAQMIEEFGAEMVGQNVITAAQRGDTRTVYEVWNLVEPHRKLPKVGSPYTLSFAKFAYRSVYWSSEAGRKENNGLLAVRGYRIKPIVAPRLEFEIGDIYGRGRGANVLGHCKALQTMGVSQLDLADQEAHPSLMAPQSMAGDGLRLSPMSVNYYSDKLAPNAVYRTLGNPPEGSRTEKEIARLEGEIRKEFFNSEFETINAMQDSSAMNGGGQSGRMTATEVRARINEKMEQLAGIATTLNDELLDPFVTMMASYAIMSGLVDVDLPRNPSGNLLPWDIKYESAIHAAVNTQPINAASTSLSMAADYARTSNDQSVLDNFDPDKMVRDIHRKLGAPEEYLRKADERDQMRQERAEAAALQEQAEQDAQNAETINKLAGTKISPETIGGQLAGAGTSGDLA